MENCPCVEKVLVAKRTNSDISMKAGRDQWLQPLLDEASDNNVAEIMDAEDPLFILYTSGSTGKPKGMVHTTAGYMVYSAYTFKNVFNYVENVKYVFLNDKNTMNKKSIREQIRNNKINNFDVEKIPCINLLDYHQKESNTFNEPQYYFKTLKDIPSSQYKKNISVKKRK